VFDEQNRYYRSADGTHIFYTIKPCPGAEYSLLLIHGMASNHTRWSEFLENTKLSHQMVLLRPDLRGHGRSMTQHTFGHVLWTLDLHAILQQENLRQVFIAGHSMGAQLALHYAATYPDQVPGLILIDPTFPNDLKGWLKLARRLRYPLGVVLMMSRLMSRILQHNKKFPYCDLHALDIQTREQLTLRNPVYLSKLYSSPRFDLRFMPLANYLQDIYETVRPLPELKSIHCPVLLLLSKKSSIVHVNSEDHFAKTTEVELVSIESNHWPLTEKPDQTRQAIDDWCYKQLEKSMSYCDEQL